VHERSRNSARLAAKLRLRATGALNRRGLLQAGAGGFLTALAGREPHRVAASTARPETFEDGAPVAVGFYVPDAVYDYMTLSRFAAEIQRWPAYLVWYEGWSYGDFSEENMETLLRLYGWGFVPVIAWDPFDPDGPPIDQPAFKLSNILRGDFDGYIESWAKGLAKFGRRVFLNFAHEMNGNWYPWGIGVNGNQPGEFIAVWRYVHDRFRRAGADNVLWVHTPNELYEDVPATIEAVYPGDEYVDWFGMNGFNWGAGVHWASCDCQSAWRTFNEIFDITYRQLTALANKPIMIGEFASSEIGGNKADWITTAFLDDIPNKYPRIRAVAWFNKIATGLDTVAPGVVEPTTSYVDWRVNSSPESLAAFVKAVADPYYKGSLR
jgi:mannan endo-1,4-beta-mannosidase